MKTLGHIHFHKEILPLFDYAPHESSREVLTRLLSGPPGSPEEVLLRQDILKGLTLQKDRCVSLAYGGAELHECRSYLTDIEDRRLKKTPLKQRIYFLFRKAERNKERSRLGHLFIYLHKVNQAYFHRLDEEAFPVSFSRKIVALKAMLSSLEVEKYQAIARRRGFTVPEMFRLSGMLYQKMKNGDWAIFWEDLFLFEAYLSISQGIMRHHLRFPEFVETGLVITEFYHPSLKDPVKNNLVVANNVTLITGPNMSGKSTLLKSIWLCVYLAHLGLAVPAEKCQLCFFDTISIAINLEDDIEEGYSHFMAEVKSVKAVALEASRSKRCFAVFDELFRGTNVEDALAISKTTIEGFTHFPDSMFFISTHLHQLRELLGPQKISTRYIECLLVDGRPAFTYTLREGWSDLKIGQIIFEQEGLNAIFNHPPL
jgi:DNA mismatch repair protein MutS